MITLIIQTDNAEAAGRVIAVADAEGCLSVAIQDGRVTRPADPEDDQ